MRYADTERCCHLADVDIPIYVAMDLHILLIRAQNTVDFPIGGHVNVLSDYKETGPDNLF